MEGTKPYYLLHMLISNELYVLYFVPILHSDTSMFVYIVRKTKLYIPEISQLLP